MTAHTRLPESAAAESIRDALESEDALVGIEVHGREVDLLLARAGDREGPDHKVDLARLQRGLPLTRIDHLQIDAVRIAEDPARDLAGEVDVEARQLTGRGIAEAEHEGVLVDADDEPSALFDGRHRRARRHRTRGRLWAGTQTGLRIAVGIGGLRCRRDLLCTSRSHRGGRKRYRRWRRLRRATSRHRQRRGEQHRRQSRAHRNSLSRGHSPTKTADAATTISTSVPVGVHAR